MRLIQTGDCTAATVASTEVAYEFSSIAHGTAVVAPSVSPVWTEERCPW